MVTADEQLKDAEHRMAGANLALQRELDSVRTGRARPGLIEHIVVEYYGTDTPLNQLASVSVPEARVLAIQPWDKSSIAAVQRALQKSDIGITPNNDGSVIRLTMPILTEERRRDSGPFGPQARGGCQSRRAKRPPRRAGQDSRPREEQGNVAGRQPPIAGPAPKTD